MAVQKDYWYFLVLVISLPLLKDSEQMKAADSSVVLQEGMVLDCLCPWTGQLIMVSWMKRPDKQPLAIFHPSFGVNFAAPYDGRVEFLKASAMDGSITMRNVTDNDEGLYSCFLQAFPNGSWTKDTLVRKQVTSTTNSYHHPNSELVVSEGENVPLRCLHTHGDGVNEISMEKLESGGGGVLLAVCVRQDGPQLQEFADRGVANCSDAMDMSLHLHSVSQGDGGLYRCNFSTDAGHQTSTILLRVIPTRGSSELQQRWYFYVGGAVVVLFLILMSVALSLRRVCRRRRRREEYRVQLHPSHGRKQNTYMHEQSVVYDKMAKSGKQQRKQSPIYANLHTVRAHHKRKQ